MLKEKGIYLEVWFEGEKLTPDKNGYLGEFDKGNFRVHYTLPKEEPKPICFTVDGNKNIFPLKSDTKTIPVIKASNGVFTTLPVSNNIRFVIFALAGTFAIWEVGIVSQDGVFFLTEQEVYKKQWFRDKNNEVVCPYFTKPSIHEWPQFLEFFRPIVKKEELPPLSEYCPPPEIKADDLSQGQGKVIFWNLINQRGLITCGSKGTVARVHWKSLPPNMNGGLRKLEAGQLVSFQGIREVPETARTTTVVLEAQGVTPL